MKKISKSEANTFENSKVCTGYEYPMNDPDINGAVVVIEGRYPDKGRVVNEKVKELAYIIEGTGALVIEGETVELKEGDLVMMEPGEKYYWEGGLKMFVPCTPAWYPEQHKEIEQS